MMPSAAASTAASAAASTAASAADVRAEIAAVEAQLGRIDAKAGLLLGLSGAGATAGPVVIPGTHLTTPAAPVAWCAVAALATAAALLARVSPELAPVAVTEVDAAEL